MNAKELPAVTPSEWTLADEKNWAANRKALRELKQRVEEPAERLVRDHTHLDARRKAVADKMALDANPRVGRPTVPASSCDR